MNPTEQKIRIFAHKLARSIYRNRDVYEPSRKMLAQKVEDEAVQALLALVAQERLDAIARVRQETELRGGGMTHPHDIA